MNSMGGGASAFSSRNLHCLAMAMIDITHMCMKMSYIYIDCLLTSVLG